jgi:hypothetical protein
MYLQVNHLNGQPEAAKVFPTLIYASARHGLNFFININDFSQNISDTGTSIEGR